MALRRSDIVEHNNPNLAVVDSDFVKGGFRTKVNNLTELYDLSLKIDEPTASGQMKEHATIVYVISENDYYVLVDIDNIDNHDGWKKFITSGSGGTIIGLTGSTNGLTDNNNIVSLGGNLITETTLNINQFNLILTGTTGSVLTTISSGSSSYVCTNINVNEIILKTNNDLNSAQIIIDKNTNKIINCVENGDIILSTCSYSGLNGKICVCSCSGIIYDSCYHDNYTNRSLVDKEYVDNKLDGINVRYAEPLYPFYAEEDDDLIAVTGYSISNEAYVYLLDKPKLGQCVTITDIEGCALKYPIIINGNGNYISSDSDDLACINSDYGSITLRYNGIFWSVVAFYN